MKLPEVQEAPKYTGLYVVDFGDHSGVGFTADEVAELLDSEKFADVKVYKIHRAYPDGTMELKGIRNETFSLEAGMFFYADSETAGREDFDNLLVWAQKQAPPTRCKVQLAKTNSGIVTALIYPAEYDDAFSRWLMDGQYRTTGTAEGGTNAVQGYYSAEPQILERQQLWPQTTLDNLHGEALLAAAKRTVVR